MLTRRSLLAGAAPALLGADRPMNVLFFAVDDLNNHVGTYGRPVKSPNIDGLAKAGVRFDRSYCQFPLCNPSRSSLFTGFRPPRTQVWGNQTWFRETMPDVVTLPQHFRENGYYTACTGKLFHDGLNDDKGWVDGSTPMRKAVPRSNQERAKSADRWEATDSEETLLDYSIASRAIEYLEKRPQNEPFFIGCGFHKPHVPFVAAKKYYDLYDPAKMTLPPDFAGMPTGTGPAYRANFDLFVNREATVPLAREAIRAYYACASFTDAQVGRVLAALDRLKLRDNTVIVLVADHGWHLGEKGMWAKLTLFEPATRVPLIISAPKMAAGKGCSRTVESLDIYPTLADLCGLKVSPKLEGKSLRPLLQDPSHAWDKPAYTFIHRPQVAGATVRTERFRYTEWDDGKTAPELYDYDQDPTESHNRAADSAQAPTVRKMKELLRAG
jgi:iduronate 2-sulfatase